MKKIIFTILAILPLVSHAFTKDEWIEKMNDSIETKKDLTWTYDTQKLKGYSEIKKEEDISVLKDIALEYDVQMSQVSKYILSLQGEKTNQFLIDNYLESDDIKNSMYYLSLNFISTSNRTTFWQYLKSKESISKKMVKDSFSMCKDFQDYSSLGGKDVTFESYDDFFEKRSLVENYTNIDLMHVEFEISDAKYPITLTFFENKFIVQSNDDEACLSPNKNEDFIYMQKILGLYKQYQKNDFIKLTCSSFEENNLLKSRFSYFCLTL